MMKKFIATLLVALSIVTPVAYAMEMPSTVTGYIGGYDDGTVRPEESITRAEMAQIIANILKIKGTAAQFDDIDNSDWYKSAVAAVSQYNLFTVKTHPYVGDWVTKSYPMSTLVNGIYESLGMESIDFGPYPARTNNFAGADKAKLEKLTSWGFISTVGEDSLVWSDKYKETTIPFDLAAWDVNRMIPLMYPDGISVEELGDPGFGTDVVEVYGIRWEDRTNFHPNANMTREEMALVLYRMSGEKATTSISYSDIGFLEAESKEAISYLASKGIVKGYTDGTFKPLGRITRAEAIVMINRFFGDAVVQTDSSFNPIDIKGHWAEEQVRKVLKDTAIRDTSKDIDWFEATGW